MSTSFYLDKEQKEFLFERRGIGLESKDYGRDLLYVFTSWTKLKMFIEMNKEELIYDEYRVVYTVDSMRNEIRRRGCIIIEKEVSEE